jgi:hypothetical protein
MRSRFYWLSGIVGSILGATLPAKAQLPPGMLTVYSNICFNPMSGDLNGLRIIVFRSATWQGGEAKPPRDDIENVYVIFQGTGGLLAPPRYTLAAIRGDQIRIQLAHPDAPDLAFVGRITPDIIDGGYSTNESRYRLRRDPDPRNKFEVCSAKGDP